MIGPADTLARLVIKIKEFMEGLTVLAFLFWASGSSCTSKNRKINKNFERKRNPGSGV